MVKRCVVINDELGNPIQCVELKEYRSVAELKTTISICKANFQAFEERRKLKEELKDKEIKELRDLIAQLKNEISVCQSQIKELLGE